MFELEDIVCSNIVRPFACEDNHNARYCPASRPKWDSQFACLGRFCEINEIQLIPGTNFTLDKYPRHVIKPDFIIIE